MKQRLGHQAPRARRQMLAMAVAACFAGGAYALPTDPTKVYNVGAINTAGGVMTINTTGARSMLKWGSFGIDAGETVKFLQPSAASASLNQVVGTNGNPATMSQIYGTLSSNGQVWLVNPAGIVVGAGGVVDTAGFVASTLKVNPDDFLAGKLSFQAEAGAGNIINQGEIKTPLGGSVYLVGANVSNEGVIKTPGGETILAAGATVNLLDTATPGVKVEITGAAGNATNLGSIVAEAGRIGIAGAIVKNSGTLDASSVVSQGGRIFLKASQDTYVDGSGRIVATGTKGGQVEVLGNRVAVMDNASIDASGANGGGTILVGGDYQGKNPDVQNAQISYFGPNATLKANATANGDGGRVIVWADDTTRAYGRIEAKGGANGGNGGFVEVSGKRYLNYRATTEVGAPRGTAGTLLLDPDEITIVTSDADLMDESLSGGVLSAAYGGPSIVGWNTIQSQLGSGSLMITTSTGDIRVAGSPTQSFSYTHTYDNGTYSMFGLGYNSANKLGLYSVGSVYIDKMFGNAGSGLLEIIAGWNGNTATPGVTGYSAGKNILFTGVAGFSGGSIVSNGPVTLKAADTVRLQGATNYGAAYIDLNTGALNIEADKLILEGVGVFGNAAITTNGAQTFTIGRTGGTAVLSLMGSDTGYGGYAKIDSLGAGNQTFNIMNGGSVSLQGGDGAGLVPAGQWSGDCYGGLCSGNYAEIGKRGSGDQIFNFASGGSLSILAGGGGNGNSAGIGNETGNVLITGNPDISMQGGAGGGYINPANDWWLSNDAFIGTDHAGGTVTIYGGTLTMNGGTATHGGAGIGGATVNIYTTGNVSLTAGTTYGGTLITANNVIAIDDNYMTYNPVLIGEGGDFATNAVVNMEVGGTFTTAGGAVGTTGGSPVAIGGHGVPANVTIKAASFNLSSNQFGTYIGSQYGGSVDLIATAGNMNLGGSFIGTNRSLGSGYVDLSATGAISQTAAGSINTYYLYGDGSSISLLGANRVGRLQGMYTTGGPFSFYGDTVDVYIVNTSAGNGAVSIQTDYAIREVDTGVTDIWAGSGAITLTSVYGGSAGGLAISVDTETTGGITATVNAGATYGGIRINDNGTTTGPSSVAMTDNATSSQGAMFITDALNYVLSSFTINTAASNAPISVVGTNDVTINGGALNSGTGNISVAAGNTLTVNADSFSNNGKLMMAAGSVLDITGNVLQSSDVLMVAPTIYNDGYISTSAGNVGILADYYYSYGGDIFASNVNSNIVGDITYNMTLNNGASLFAGNEVGLTFFSGDSTLTLNEISGMSPSRIYAQSPSTIYLDFKGRSSGGVIIDGVETTTTVDPGSGFYNMGAPASPGSGLIITYGQQLDPCVLNPAICQPPEPPEPPEPPPIIDPNQPPVVGPGGTDDTGGGEGEFGGNENGGQGDNKQKQAKKKAAQCKG